MRRLVGLWFVAASGAVLYGQASVLTWHNDNARTGQNLQETVLTPAIVAAGTFQKLFVIGVDGKVDAQPLYVPSVAIPGQGLRNTLYVVTENDSAYAFDADTGVQLWHVSLLGAGETPSDDRGCSQVTPEIGITSTPVIDPRVGPNGAMYGVAMSKTASGTYHQRIHALDLTSGSELFGGPVDIQATYPGSGAEGSGTMLTFDPAQHKERAALVIVNGVVYTAWSSHCDSAPYTGWVIGYNENTLAQVSVFNLTPNGSDGGIWGAGSGPAADSAGYLYLLMGNGTFDTTLNTAGMPVNGDYGNAFVKLSTNGALAVADYFTMFNTTSESGGDVDLGSGGAMVLPTLTDADGKPRMLAVGAGKDHQIYVVDRNNMGKYVPGTNAIYEDLANALAGGVFSSPAWFNGNLYYGAVGDHLKEFGFADGAFGTNPLSQSPASFGYPGTTPSISANGVSNGIVWAAENTDPAVLHAYDAADLSTELYNSNTAANGRDQFGSGNKFIVPTVVNGKVYVGTTSGVGVFGILAPAISLITPNTVPFEQLTTLTVTGSNFASGFTASVTVGGTNYAVPAADLTFVSSSEVQIEVYMEGAASYTATLNIINPGGFTASQNFQVSSGGGSLQPAISSITPNPVPWEQLTSLTVNGSNFQNGFTASVTVGGTNYTLSPPSLTFVSSSEVQVPVYMGGATSYTATLNISNPGGLTTSQNFQVSSGGGSLQPAISSITPNPVPWEQLTTLTVNGSNFESGLTASVNVGGTNYPLSPASLTFVSSSQVQVPVYMGGATSYTATLNITNPGGLTASQNFQVGSSGGGGLQPAISSIAPNPVPWEQLTTLTVNGSNFQSGLTASVNVGGTNYPLSPASLTFVSSSQVQVPVYMGGATSYTATLNITNPGGLTASQNFQVGSNGGGNLQPAISSITPNPVPWEQLTTLTVNGSNFESGLTASVNVGGTNYPLSPASLTFVSSSQVQVPVYMGGATSYTATLNITNPGGLTASQNFQVGSSGGGGLQPAISSIAPNPVPGSN